MVIHTTSRWTFFSVLLLPWRGILSILALRFGDEDAFFHRKEAPMATARRLPKARKKVSRMAKKAKLRARKTVRAAKRAGQKTRTAAQKAAGTVKRLKRPRSKPKRTAA